MVLKSTKQSFCGWDVGESLAEYDKLWTTVQGIITTALSIVITMQIESTTIGATKPHTTENLSFQRWQATPCMIVTQNTVVHYTSQTACLGSRKTCNSMPRKFSVKFHAVRN